MDNAMNRDGKIEKKKERERVILCCVCVYVCVGVLKNLRERERKHVGKCFMPSIGNTNSESYSSEGSNIFTII